MSRDLSALEAEVRQKIDGKTKPIGALGELEQIALKIAMCQETVSPKLKAETLFVFAGDHGLATEGVSPYPQEVTHQMVLNFLSGGAAINVFAKQHGWQLKVVDAGVNFSFPDHEQLIPRKVAMGTTNMLFEPAMTKTQFEKAWQTGAQLIMDLEDTNLVAFGEMGIGNTSAASLIMHYITGVPIADCIGRGTGLDNPGLIHKKAILERVVERVGTPTTATEIGCECGGFELVMMAGAMEAAAQRNMVILVDGFIVTAALLLAHKQAPDLLQNCIFAHCSGEQGHGQMLDWLGVKPLLQLGLRLGEGTGAALALPLVRSAVAFLNEMASFESAGVSQKDA